MAIVKPVGRFSNRSPFPLAARWDTRPIFSQKIRAFLQVDIKSASTQEDVPLSTFIKSDTFSAECMEIISMVYCGAFFKLRDNRVHFYLRIKFSDKLVSLSVMLRFYFMSSAGKWMRKQGEPLFLAITHHADLPILTCSQSDLKVKNKAYHIAFDFDFSYIDIDVTTQIRPLPMHQYDLEKPDPNEDQVVVRSKTRNFYMIRELLGIQSKSLGRAVSNTDTLDLSSYDDESVKTFLGLLLPASDQHCSLRSAAYVLKMSHHFEVEHVRRTAERILTATLLEIDRPELEKDKKLTRKDKISCLLSYFEIARRYCCFDLESVALEKLKGFDQTEVDDIMKGKSNLTDNDKTFISSYLADCVDRSRDIGSLSMSTSKS